VLWVADVRVPLPLSVALPAAPSHMPPPVDEFAVCRPLRVLPLVERLPTWVTKPLGLDRMFCPGVFLPPASVPDEHDAPQLEFLLWGITFDIVSDLVVVRIARYRTILCACFHFTKTLGGLPWCRLAEARL
jgi:hypothetical protein